MPDKHPISLSHAEWSLMDYLWDHAPCTGRDAAKYCEEHNGWSRTTTLTILRRVVDKGVVACDESQKRNIYTPTVNREDAMMQETTSFLQRVYKGSVSLMLSALTKKQELSLDEIEELRAILRDTESEASK